MQIKNNAQVLPLSNIFLRNEHLLTIPRWRLQIGPTGLHFALYFTTALKIVLITKKKYKYDYEIYSNIVLCKQDRKTMSDVCVFVKARSSQRVVRHENAKASWSKSQTFGRGLEDHS